MHVLTHTLERLFGKSQNVPLAGLLHSLAEVSAACIKTMKDTQCRDIARVTHFEHEGDDLESQIHEILDNSFILRFDKPDVVHLAAELDDMLDGMRRVAKHVHMYQPILKTLRPEVLEFLDIIESMTIEVQKLTEMLSHRKLSQHQIKTLVKEIEQSESAADKILERVESSLINEFNAPGKNVIEFTAWDKLFRLLERITDSADHCGRCVLSMARKEA